MSSAVDERQPVFGRSFWWFSISFLLMMFALLLGPHLPDDQQAEQCVVNVRLPGPFGFALNCDSPEFMRLALDPGALLEPRNTRQSRPGLIVVAGGLAWVLSPLTGLADKARVQASRSDIDPQRIANALAKNLPAYLAYIILNVTIVLVAFYYFRRICTPWVDNGLPALVAVAAIGCLLFTNDPVKAFVWTPHTTMFNIMVPLFALYASMRANTGALLQRRFAIAVGILTGLGGTAYPLFMITLPCVVVCAFIFVLRCGSRKDWLNSIINIFVFTVLTLAPEAIWFAFVRLETGGFYQHEISENAVVWILSAWHQGLETLVITWWTKLELLLRLAALQAVPIVSVLVVAAALKLTNRHGAKATQPSLWSLAATAFLVSAATALFYSGVGIIYPRLAYALIPPLTVVVAACGLAVTTHDNLLRRIFAYSCVTIALITAVYTVVKAGPYS